MKARIIFTQFWDDSFIYSLSSEHILLFNYFLTNENVNIIHLYEIPEHKIMYQTKLKAEQIHKGKEIFQKSGKIFFNAEYVYLKNAAKYETYNGSKNDAAKEILFKRIPKHILDWYNNIKDTPIHTPILPLSKTPIKEEKKIDLEEKTETLIILGAFNTIMKTNYKVAPESNIKFWLTRYSKEEIIQAFKKIPYHSFWKDKATPEKIFRRRNTNQEEVDHIGELLNLKVASQSRIQEHFFKK